VTIKLNPIQRRVFGVLIEKSLTTPGNYPLTLNAILAGSNQLSCRNPVMQLSEGDVARTVQQLQSPACGQLVQQAPPEPTARANRFLHLAEQRFGWDKRERAIMAELLLRGPQTLGELKGNASRMTPLDDINAVSALLNQLAEHDPAFVRELPRQPGQRASQFDHLLYPDEEIREAEAVRTAPVTPAAARPMTAPAVMPPAGEPVGAELEARVARLETEVAALREQLASLRADLG